MPKQEPRELKVHPKADLFPMMSDEELADLAEDIKANGLAHPLVVDEDNQLIDGRNRLAACQLAGVEPRFEQLNGRDPLAYIASTNLKRRNLSKGQQAMAHAMIYPEPGTRGKKKSSSETKDFSEARLSQARSVLRHAPEAAKSVIAGDTGLDEALAEVKASQSRITSDAVKMQRLDSEAPDLADLVREGKVQLSVAIAETEQRVVNERNSKRSATRALNSLLAALEAGEASPQEAAAKWIARIDFGLEPYPLPLTKARLNSSLRLVTLVLEHLKEGAK